MSAQRSFRYSIHECDVEGDKAALQRFRDKRLVWENWLDGDPDHAIWANISQLVWREVAFGTLAHIADSQKSSALHNTLITEAVLHGHVALQAMTIRRLVDTSKSTISLPRLLRNTPYLELGLDDESLSDDALLDAMEAHPILINRPFVITPKGVRLSRPSEVVLEILPNPDIGEFTKEDGEIVRPKGPAFD